MMYFIHQFVCVVGQVFGVCCRVDKDAAGVSRAEMQSDASDAQLAEQQSSKTSQQSWCGSAGCKYLYHSS